MRRLFHPFALALAAVLIGELSLCAPLAPAQTPQTGGTGSAMIAATVGTSPATVLPANTTSGFRLIFIDNESTTATLACTLTGTPAANTAGSVTLAPGTRVVLGGVSDISIREPVNCVASAAGTPATIFAL